MFTFENKGVNPVPALDSRQLAVAVGSQVLAYPVQGSRFKGSRFKVQGSRGTCHFGFLIKEHYWLKYPFQHPQKAVSLETK
jgi:hypothetical protein